MALSFDPTDIKEQIRKAMNAHVDNIPKGNWKTAKGEVIDIEDMGNGHLRNTMNMLRRKGLEEKAKYFELVCEAKRRGWTIDEDDFNLEGAL